MQHHSSYPSFRARIGHLSGEAAMHGQWLPGNNQTVWCRWSGEMFKSIPHFNVPHLQSLSMQQILSSSTVHHLLTDVTTYNVNIADENSVQVEWSDGLQPTPPQFHATSPQWSHSGVSPLQPWHATHRWGLQVRHNNRWHCNF